ncbi:MAG: membrane-bound metal-dependent hydrolase YbcI (DUF457 family) [Myxococcota bacterium]
MARAGSGFGFSIRAASILCVLAANAPDLDILMWPSMGFETYVLYRQGLTHSIIAVIAIGLFVGVIAAKMAGVLVRRGVLLATLAALVHVILDSLTVFGVEPFAPFSHQIIASGTLFQTDLILLAVVSLAVWLPAVARVEAGPVARFTLGLGAVYIVAAGVFQMAAVASQSESGTATAVAFAAPLSPLHWSVVVPGDPIELRAVDSLNGVVARQRAAKNREHPAVRAVTGSPLGARFVGRTNGLWWSEVRCLKTGFAVLLFSAQSQNAWSPANSPLVSEVTSKNGVLTVDEQYWAAWITGRKAPAADCPDTSPWTSRPL